MPIGGYMSGGRAARRTPSMSNHNQCGGPKKQGLKPNSGYNRQGMGRLKSIVNCNSCALQFTCANIPVTRKPACSGGVGRKLTRGYR